MQQHSQRRKGERRFDGGGENIILGNRILDRQLIADYCRRKMAENNQDRKKTHCTEGQT